jgi:hypothetical protein
MKEMIAHMLVIVSLGHVGVIIDQDLGQDQGLRVAEVRSGAKETAFMMIIASTKEENMTGMKEGMMI